MSTAEQLKENQDYKVADISLADWGRREIDIGQRIGQRAEVAGQRQRRQRDQLAVFVGHFAFHRIHRTRLFPTHPDRLFLGCRIHAGIDHASRDLDRDGQHGGQSDEQGREPERMQDRIPVGLADVASQNQQFVTVSHHRQSDARINETGPRFAAAVSHRKADHADHRRQRRDDTRQDRGAAAAAQHQPQR